MALRVLFDTTRLAWRARRNSPTGIDRVVLAYANWLRGRDDIDLVPVALAGDRLTTIAPARFTDLLAQAATADHAPADEAAWAELQQALSIRPALRPALRRPMVATPASDWLPLGADIAGRMISSRMKPTPTGDLYINVAHTGLHRPGLLADLAARSVAPVVLVHDLIPITHPEYCTPDAGERHTARIAAVLGHAALVIANSRATADDLARYAADAGRRLPPVEVAWLGVEPAFHTKQPEPGGLVPYFVCVGTIEARKNLAFLLSLWRRLAEDMREAPPHLVLVGRRGWENEAVIDHLERSPVVRSLVHEVADLSDAHLSRLVGGARALLAPSFAEGFDLPPVEALALGTPVIASDIAVHREVAKGARLVDPLDGPGWIAAIRAACSSRQPAAAQPPASWAAHFELVGAAMSRLAGAP